MNFTKRAVNCTSQQLFVGRSGFEKFFNEFGPNIIKLRYYVVVNYAKFSSSSHGYKEFHKNTKSNLR